MRNCILCQQLTNGAIGAAGMYWRNVCPTCKASEDAALKLRINAEAQGLKFVMEKLFGLGEPGSGESAGQAPMDSLREPKSLDVDTLRKEEKMKQFL